MRCADSISKECKLSFSFVRDGIPFGCFQFVLEYRDDLLTLIKDHLERWHLAAVLFEGYRMLLNIGV